MFIALHMLMVNNFKNSYLKYCVLIILMEMLASLFMHWITYSTGVTESVCYHCLCLQMSEIQTFYWCSLRWMILCMFSSSKTCWIFWCVQYLIMRHLPSLPAVDHPVHPSFIPPHIPEQIWISGAVLIWQIFICHPANSVRALKQT